MNKLKLIAVSLIMGVPLMAADSLEVGPVAGKASALLTIALIVIKLIGVLIVAWGIYESMVEKDDRNEGKKVNGVLKIGGGAALLLLGSVIGWVTGGAGTDPKIAGDGTLTIPTSTTSTTNGN